MITGGSFFFIAHVAGFRLFACHLASVAHSGRDTHFRKNIGLEQNPDPDNDEHNNKFFHDFLFYIAELSPGFI
jgi:hypothetical protein